MLNENLKACPCCGSVANIDQDEKSPWSISISCVQCDLTMPPHPLKGGLPMDRWNLRWPSTT
jgi:hypothetical protein